MSNYQYMLPTINKDIKVISTTEMGCNIWLAFFVDINGNKSYQFEGKGKSIKEAIGHLIIKFDWCRTKGEEDK